MAFTVQDQAPTRLGRAELLLKAGSKTPMNETILSVGREAGLLALRSLVLRTAGFRVIEALGIEFAAETARDREIDLVLFCHSISPAECERIISCLQPTALVFAFVVTHSCQDVPSGATGVPNAGEELVKAIEALVREPALEAAPDSARKRYLLPDRSLRIA